jgi:hypothetical protein
MHAIVAVILPSIKHTQRCHNVKGNPDLLSNLTAHGIFWLLVRLDPASGHCP